MLITDNMSRKPVCSITVVMARIFIGEHVEGVSFVE